MVSLQRNPGCQPVRPFFGQELIGPSLYRRSGSSVRDDRQAELLQASGIGEPVGGKLAATVKALDGNIIGLMQPAGA
jgi:hypothetical protein